MEYEGNRWVKWNELDWKPYEKLTLQATIPICGWEWIKSRLHIIPEYHIDMTIGGNRYNMIIKDSCIIKGLVKINTIKHKPKVEVYPPSHYSWVH